MTLTELKEDLVEFLKEKGIYVYNIEAQIQFGLDYVPQIQIQLEGSIKED